ncbi:MAG TPA: hypothetical protein VGG21_07310 [Acidimicrobiales bacterium]|jgi:hypothetical protein
MKSGLAWVGRRLIGFLRFWWDFLVGDTPEITVVVLVVLGVVALASESAHQNVLAYVALPALVVGGLALSLMRARRRMKN